MNDKDKLRIGDSDRELVSRLLKSAVDEGRLTLAEYDARLQHVYLAETVGDLDPITTDLVGADRGVLSTDGSAGLASFPQTSAARKNRAGKPAGSRASGPPDWIKWMWFGWAVPVVLCTVIWGIAAMSGEGIVFFWPLWIAGPLGAVMGSVTAMERFMIRPALRERDNDRVAGRVRSRDQGRRT